MNKDEDKSNEKKLVNKAKSHDTQSPTLKIKNESKRKSFYVNDAVKSLDLALVRLKKSKLVNGDSSNSPQTSSARRGADMFMDVSSSYSVNQSADNTSLVSMNFSHYELMRNLSRTNCNSDGACSGSTCNAFLSSTDTTVKNEHLERYFRSAEIWNRSFRDSGPSSVKFESPEK
ncbi:uncharacterized protein ACR2FA_003174 [Aphomia sociella]